MSSSVFHLEKLDCNLELPDDLLSGFLGLSDNSFNVDLFRKVLATERKDMFKSFNQIIQEHFSKEVKNERSKTQKQTH